MSINWSDSVTKIFRHISLELLGRIKEVSKDHKQVSIASVPMPGSRDTFRVTIKASSHSWVASNSAFIAFWDSLPSGSRQTLNLLKD